MLIQMHITRMHHRRMNTLMGIRTLTLILTRTNTNTYTVILLLTLRRTYEGRLHRRLKTQEWVHIRMVTLTDTRPRVLTVILTNISSSTNTSINTNTNTSIRIRISTSTNTSTCIRAQFTRRQARMFPIRRGCLIRVPG